MPTNPFEDLLKEIATQIADASSKWPLNESKVLSILRSNLNPFPPQVQDRFQSQFNIQNFLNPKQR